MTHLLAIEGLYPPTIASFLAEDAPAPDRLRGRTVALRFGAAGRTRDAFARAAGRLGATVVDVAFADETLTATADRLAVCDVSIVRDPCSGVPALLARRVRASVVNAGDGRHEHPVWALATALGVRRAFGRLDSLLIAITGDITGSGAARSAIHLFTAMGSRVRLVAPPEQIPPAAERLGVELSGSTIGADMVVRLDAPPDDDLRLTVALAVLDRLAP